MRRGYAANERTLDHSVECTMIEYRGFVAN